MDSNMMTLLDFVKEVFSIDFKYDYSTRCVQNGCKNCAGGRSKSRDCCPAALLHRC